MTPASPRSSDESKAVAEDSSCNGRDSAELPPLVLPFSHRSEPSLPVQLASLPVALSVETTAQILSLAFHPELVFLAAWYVLLWRFTDQSEIVVGYLAGGCGGGAAVRTLPLRVSFAKELSFSDVIVQLRNARREARQTGNNLDFRNFDTAFPAMFCAEDERRTTSAEVTHSRFQIMLRVRTHGLTWKADLLYDPSSLSHDSVDRMSRSFSTLLTDAVADPKSSTHLLPILSEEDRHRVTVDFNQTAAWYPADKCIHELFEEQVERWPDRVALCDRKQVLTYIQLNERANRLAHLLRRWGAAPNLPIALYMDRSAEMIVGLLAILKAGACYLPLIPSDPQARVARQIADTKPAILLTAQTLAHSLPDYDGEVVLIDQSYEQEAAHNLELRTTPDDLVYILFTSGSTGVPKGVATRHRNLVNYTHFICRQLQLQDYPGGWQFATVSTLAADLGNTSIFGALTSGGCLHVIDYETAMTPELFAAYMAKHPIDLLKIAPSHLAALLRDSEGGAVLPRRFVVVGGEKLTWDLLRDIRRRGKCSVMNHYGPTETTVGCCTLIVNEASFAEWRPATIPLGRPIANDQVYILDRRLQPVPIGVPGELHMSGAGLSCGYFNQQEQTAARFIAHPFSLNSTDRLYRTGDLARFLPDGTIEFLGRTDHQVKIRGFRVEPAELEAALRRHPDIREAVVVSEENQQGERVLAAYVSSPKLLTEDDLRGFVARQVPDYMLPARLVVLDNLPLNTNGKIDLPALPNLGKRAHQCEKSFRGPGNPDEEKLAAIWAAVLGLEHVGVDDNFFALGGHSLLATRVISRIRKVFGVNFPLYAFLENPTIRASAARMGDFEHLTANEDEELAHLLREIGDMSEEEVERLLADET
jgi:amino acid adenylation domain-containing protein